jgi:phosphoglycerate dehydrogenase-like enzyme
MDSSTVITFSPVPAPLLQQWIVSRLGPVPVQVIAFDEVPEAEQSATLAKAQVALGDYTFRRGMDEALLARMPQLKFIQQPSVGYEHIDLEACRRRGVQVANTPGVNSVAVAEHTIMLALALLRRLTIGNEATHTGRWSQHEMMWDRGVFELAGKTYGLVGCGAVGKEVAKRLRPFGTALLYFDARRLPPETETELGVTYKPLDHLLRVADVISLHVPLTDSTRKLIGTRELGLMKFSAVLINVARGECVDEAALAERLRAKKLGGAGLDVFAHEPIAADCPLFGLDNVILTPHIGGATNEVRERVVLMAVANVVQVLQGKPPQYVLNAS